MKTALLYLSPFVLAMFVALSKPAVTPAIAQGADDGASGIVLVVARELGVRDISLSVVRRAFRGESTELNGHRLVPFNYAPESALRRAFDLTVLDMRSDEVGRYWVDRRMRGQGMPPRTVPSQAMLRAVVARLPGAIGYMSADQLDPSVQPLRIDGRHHGEPGYPLIAR